MKVAVVGRGNVGGGLADLWERAGHELTRIGREGDEVSEAEAVLVAVPGSTIVQALDNVEASKARRLSTPPTSWVPSPRRASPRTPSSSSRGRTVLRRSHSTPTSR